MTWDEVKVLDRIRELDCGHGNGCTCVDKFISELFEFRRDLLKQHQEDARLWQIEKHKLTEQLLLVEKDRNRFMEMYAEATEEFE